MLRKLKVEEIGEAATLAYKLSLSPSTNSYTLRESEKEYLEAFQKVLEYPDDALLGYFIENELIAVIYINVLKKDLYLQTRALFINKHIDPVMSEFYRYLKENYSGFEIYSGYPKENELVINNLLSKGFEIIESSTDQRLKREEFLPSKLINNIVKITQDNYSEFAKYHDLKAIDVYWNSKRIREHFEDWIIYAYWEGSQLRASINAKMYKNQIEIFALLIDDEIANNGIEEDMITVTLKEGFANHNVENAVFFIDSDDKSAEAFSKKLGFSVYSNYRCLYKKL